MKTTSVRDNLRDEIESMRLRRGPNRRVGRRPEPSRREREKASASSDRERERDRERDKPPGGDGGPPRKSPAKAASTPKGGGVGRERLREATGVILAALSSALLLSLVSYRADPEAANLIGPVGRAAASGMLFAMGLCAYPFVIALGVAACFLVLGRALALRVSEAVGVLGAAVSATVLFDVLSPALIQGQLAGGALGALLGGLGREHLSVAGTAIGSVMALCVSLIVAADVRPSAVARVVWQVGGQMFARTVWRVVWHGLVRPVGRFTGRVVADTRDEWATRREARVRAAEMAEEPSFDDEEDEGGVREHERHLEGEPSWSDPTMDASEWPGRDDEDGDDGEEGAAGHDEPDIDEDALALAIAEAAREDAAETATLLDQELEVCAEDVVALEDLPPETETAPLLTPAPAAAARPAAAPGPGATPALALAPKIIDRRAIPAPAMQPREPEMLPPEFADFGGSRFQLPSLDLLDYDGKERSEVDRSQLIQAAAKLEQKLADYSVEGNVVEIHPGPVITMFEFKPAPGTRVSKIANLADDLAMALEAETVRIVAPIPGKPVVGIEIPNLTRETVFLKEIIGHPAFARTRSKLAIALGKDIAGAPVVADLGRMPHLLVAGATGSGKSVCLSSIIVSLLYNATPDEVRLLMVDPKMLEFGIYDGIPHLLAPVVTDPKKAAVALRWAVEEMERRYQLLAEAGVRNIQNYNNKIEKQLEKLAEKGESVHDLPAADQPRRLPFIVVVLDELADLMMVASRDVETSIARLAQMARAAGIHLIVATQRPSVDVITGMIKANFPTRIAFKVATKVDSRTILDENGAEHLLGRGDMLVTRPGASKLERVHGALVTEEEIHRLVAFLKQQAKPQYDKEILRARDEDGDGAGGAKAPVDDLADALYDQAVAVAAETGAISISLLQRRMKVGYNRAARMVERMEKEGLIGPQGAAGQPREVLVSPA